MNDHLSRDEIEALVSGQAPQEQLDRWLDHLGDCDDCLLSTERAWPASLRSTGKVPALESARSRDMQARIFHRIHVLETSKQALRLALLAPLAFLQGLLGTKRR